MSYDPKPNFMILPRFSAVHQSIEARFSLFVREESAIPELLCRDRLLLMKIIQ